MKTPLYLINGPLGAGKTTFLKYLLSRPSLSKARVIENEFASTSVDTAQLHDHTAEVQTIAGLCICCSTGDELTEALTSLAGSADPVIIEATGVANSLQLIEKIVVADMLDHYDIVQASFVLDAVEAFASIDETLAAYRQELQAADVVYVSKTDLLTADDADSLFAALGGLSISSLVILREGVPDEELSVKASSILTYFAQLQDSITSHDGDTNYTILSTDDLPLDPETLDTLWPELRDTFSLKRMKGNATGKDGKKYHVEATPAQCRVTEYDGGEAALVLIGGNAREATRGFIVARL